MTLQISQESNIPDKICDKCLDHTISSYLFAQQCDHAERAMENCIQDIYDKVEHLDPLELPKKKRGRQKLNPNPNVIHACYENVMDYAEPQISLINRGSNKDTEQNVINPLECPRCWQEFSSIELLMHHEKIHPKSMWWHCRLCGTSFPKQTLYRRHLKESHPVGKPLPDPIKTKMMCKCNVCGQISENYISHLQHLEKHKFKTLMHHMLNRKMDKLCVVCLEKGTEMVSLDNPLKLHGGYPEVTGDRSLYNILSTALPNVSIYFYYNHSLS